MWCRLTGVPANAIRELTDLAIEIFDAQPSAELVPLNQFGPVFGDPVLDGALAPNGLLLDFYRGPALAKAVDAVKADPAMEPLAGREGELDPFLSSAGGGARQDLQGLIVGTVTAAVRGMYFESAEQAPAVLVQRVIENYEALKRIARGEPIQIRIVHGLAGVILPPGAQIATPWGVVKPAPVPKSNQRFYALGGFRPATTAVLLRTHTGIVGVSRDESLPEMLDPEREVFETEQRIRELLPLAFALAVEGDRRCAPVVSFTTALPPFSSGFGSSSSGILSSPWQQTTIQEDDVPAIEEWARRLNTRHVENLQVTARRIVSAIAVRTDKSDALVDAVMAWEGLVGTNSETVFRVTAALSRLLEANSTERRALRKVLGDTYNLRSRVVHGDTVDQVKVAEAADKAIDVALAATRALYGRRPEWLTYSSTERADRLVLEE